MRQTNAINKYYSQASENKTENDAYAKLIRKVKDGADRDKLPSIKAVRLG